MLQITVHPFSAENVRLSQEQVVAIYADAFRPAPYKKTDEEIAEFEAQLTPATKRKGFVAAVAQIESVGQPIGFCYGYTVSADTYFYKLVAKNLNDAAKTFWLTDCFQLTEMAVLPHYQGRGIGGELHNTLLNAQSHPKAILATMKTPSNATALYEKRGWQVLIDYLKVPQLNRAYQIMGIAKP